MNFSRLVFVVASISTLIGCSGGGGGGGSSLSTSFNISGSVTGATGVTINLTGASSVSATTDGNGNYNFTGLPNGKYTVTPTSSGNTFTPISTVVTGNGTSINVSALTASSAITTNCLSGTLSGAALQNIMVSLNGANYGAVLTDSSGNYSFCGLVNGNYTVTPSLSGYSFPLLATITISNASSLANNFVSTIAPSSSTLSFLPSTTIPQATTGSTYSNSVIGSTTGGSPPYFYRSDSFATGAPPLGMIVDLNGNLTGTPSVAGTYTVGLCAVDQVGSSSCGTATVKVVQATITGTWSGSFVWPGAAYIGCTSTPINVTLSLLHTGNNITGYWGTAALLGTVSNHTLTMTQTSTIFGTGSSQSWTWDGQNTITASVGYGCYDLSTLAVQQHDYYGVTLTRQ